MSLLKAIRKTWLQSETFSVQTEDGPIAIKLTAPTVKSVFNLFLELNKELPDSAASANIFLDDDKVAKLSDQERMQHAENVSRWESEHLYRLSRIVLRNDEQARELPYDEFQSLLERNPELVEAIKRIADVKYLNPKDIENENPSE